MKNKYLYCSILLSSLAAGPTVIMPMQTTSVSADDIGENECGICMVDFEPKKLIQIVCNKKLCRACLKANARRPNCPFCTQPWDGNTGVHCKLIHKTGINSEIKAKPNFVPFYVAGGILITAAASYGAYQLYKYFTRPKDEQKSFNIKK